VVEVSIIYDVHATRDGQWWVVTVPEVPGAFSQVRRLDQVDEAIREAIGFVAQVPIGSVGVDTVIDLPVSVVDQVAQARRAVTDAEQARRDAAALSRAAALRLLDAGVTGHDAAHIMGVSPQRISQLTTTDTGQSITSARRRRSIRVTDAPSLAESA
jgi:predicted RNase H-like HicB family nuclease